MIFNALSNAGYCVPLRDPGAELAPPPPSGGGKSRGPAGRGLTLTWPVISSVTLGSTKLGFFWHFRQGYRIPLGFWKRIWGNEEDGRKRKWEKWGRRKQFVLEVSMNIFRISQLILNSLSSTFIQPRPTRLPISATRPTREGAVHSPLLSSKLLDQFSKCKDISR